MEKSGLSCYRTQVNNVIKGQTLAQKRVIPLLDLAVQYKGIATEVSQAVERVLSSQQFILGPEVKLFESEFAAYCQTKFAVGCASGSDALLLALMALGIGKDDEVITTPYSFFATVSSIVRLGAKPVFVDIDEQTFNLDAKRLEEKITPRTKAILPVHLFGQCADMAAIQQISNSYSIPIVEDAAQAIGSKYNHVKAGGLGTLATFSFYPSKNLGGAGDGGMLTTNDSSYAERLLMLRVHGARRKYFHDAVGVNSRLDSLQAAILRVKLSYLDQWTDARRFNSKIYREYFTQSELLSNGLISLPGEIPAGFHVYNQFVIRAKNRDSLKQYLSQNGIGSDIYYPLPLHLQPCFNFLGHRSGDMPVAELASMESLAIPIYPELSREDLQYIVQTISDFYQNE